MTTWQQSTLGEHIDLLSGPAFKSTQFTEDGRDTLLLRGENVGQGFLKWEKAKRWPVEDTAKYERYQLRDDDVILAMDRPWIPAGLKWAYIRARDLPVLLVQRVARMRAGPALDQHFLRYMIASPQFTSHVHAITTGANIPHISGKDIKSFEFRLPPLPIQKRIAAILSAYDDLIEVNTRRIAILEEMARRIYEEWFVRGADPAWDQGVASDIIDFNPRTKVPKDGDKLFIPMGALSERSMIIGELERKTGNSGSKFMNGDTLLARITPCLENGKTGYVTCLPPEQPSACGSTEFIVMRSKVVTPEYVYLLARSEPFREVARRSMSGATGRQRVRVESLVEFPVAIPQQAKLSRFSETVRPMFQLVQTLASQNANLRAQRDLLLPRIVSGKLDVSTLDAVEEELTDA